MGTNKPARKAPVRRKAVTSNSTDEPTITARMKELRLAAKLTQEANVAAALQVIDLATSIPTPKSAPVVSVVPIVETPTLPVPASTTAPAVVPPTVTAPPAIAAKQIPGTPAPSKATAPAAAAVAPKPTPPPAPKEYSGRIRVTFWNDTIALGLDLATNMTVIIEPRFQGAHPGLVGNRVIRQTRTTVTVACRSGAEDRAPYRNPTEATHAAVAAAGTALGVLKALGSH